MRPMLASSSGSGMEGAPRGTVTHKLRREGSAVYVIGFGTS